MPARSNQNLSKEEAAILRGIAAYHGHLAVSGPYAGQGSGLALQLAIIAGDVQTVSLDPDELALVVTWLAQQAEQLPDGALREALAGLAAQLSQCLPPMSEQPPASGATGPIDTMEG